MFNNKGNMIKYLLKNDTNIKEIDSAIPLSYITELRTLNIDYRFFSTIYYKNGTITIENLNDRLLIIYNGIYQDYLQSESNRDSFVNLHKLDINEVNYLEYLIDIKG